MNSKICKFYFTIPKATFARGLYWHLNLGLGPGTPAKTAYTTVAALLDLLVSIIRVTENGNYVYCGPGFPENNSAGIDSYVRISVLHSSKSGFPMKIAQLAFLTWTYLTLAGILGSTLMIPMAYLDFELRKEYIQEVLCINRGKPELSCEGKCFLMKKLDQANDIPAADRQSAHENFQLSFFRVVENQLLYGPKHSIEASPFNAYLNWGSTSQYSNYIFHPPEVS